jgi:hypothetical protein
MDQHLGASYTLSVLIVIASAICLHGSDHSPTSASKQAKPPEANSSASRTKERAVARTVSHTPVRRASATKVDTKPVTAIDHSIVKTASHVVRTRPASLPREPFTKVEENETLKDVALRVYGTTDDMNDLWKANRDQLESSSSPLRSGMILRTP